MVIIFQVISGDLFWSEPFYKFFKTLFIHDSVHLASEQVTFKRKSFQMTETIGRGSLAAIDLKILLRTVIESFHDPVVSVALNPL